jgi:hypothetical protein
MVASFSNLMRLFTSIDVVMADNFLNFMICKIRMRGEHLSQKETGIPEPVRICRENFWRCDA